MGKEMKKKFTLLFALLISVTGAFAEGSLIGIERAANFVSGYTASFDIMLQNNADVDYDAWQMFITLPEGITFKEAVSGEIATTTHKNGTTARMSDGKLKITVTSNPATIFSQKEGQLMRVYFNVADNATGDKTFSFSDIEIRPTGSSTGTTVSLADFTVTIGDNITLSENETPAFIEKSNVDVTVERTLKGGKWNTIVLPFDMSAAQIADADAFGNSVEIVELTGVTCTMPQMMTFTGIKFAFTSVNSISANKPYLIKVGSDMSSFKAKGVNLPASAIPTVITVNDNTNTWFTAQFYGNYTSEFTIPENGLYISDNMFKYTTGTTKLKAYRAYIKTFMPLSNKSLEAGARSISFTVDGENTTGIYNVEDGKFYNLKGQLVENPTKGVYVVNGKKVIIK